MTESSLDQQILVDEPAWWTSPAAWGALLLALVLTIGGIVFFYWREDSLAEKAQTAQLAYDQATTPEDRLSVARTQADAPAAAVWLMDVGNTLYQAKKYDLSAQAYALIVEKQPDSPLINGALLGQAESLMADNKSDQALPLLNRLIQAKEKNAYQPLARILLAHWQIDHNKIPEAKQTLADLQTESPNGAFNEEAAEILSTLPK